MTYLISFASKTPRDFSKSQKRLNKSAEKNYSFSKIKSYKFNNIDFKFIKKNKSILAEKRGSGYWLWKPYFIYKTLLKMKDNDILLYCDSGLEFISDPTPLLSLVNSENSIILFQTHGHKNYIWTKRDAFVLMNCDTEQYYNAEQVAGGYQLYYKCEQTMNFVREYLDFCSDRRIITDDKNTTSENIPGFIEHRHDQSILSLLAKKYNIEVHRDPSQFGNDYLDKFVNSNYPQIFNHHRESTLSFFYRLKRKIIFLKNYK